MALRHKVVRSDHITRAGDERNVVRGHALFVRFMERKGLGDCIRYFPDSMTLGNLRTATQHELLTKYDVRDVQDRERIMRIVDESHREDQSDVESDYSSSPKQSTVIPAVAVPSTDDVVTRRVPSAAGTRLLQRTLSETVRHRRPDKIQTGAASSLGKHLSSSQFGLNVSWNSGPQQESSNLLRMRNSVLGKSEPLLSSTARDVNVISCCSTPASRRPSGRVAASRRSLILPASCAMSLSLPLPAAPVHLLGSPLDSPRSASSAQSHSQFQFLSKSVVDSRRWSVASLASSGCSTSNSQYSSQEKLHHTLPTTPDTPSLAKSRHHFSSNDSNTALVETETGDGQGSSSGNSSGLRSPLLRPRSQSLSSPARSPGLDSGTMMMNNVYRERFPKATEQMEERLMQFIESNNQLEELATLESDGAARFVHHQVVELARDCLTKSQSKLISASYFYELSENLERLLHDAQLRSATSLEHVTQLIKKLLMIVSRPARLLECLEFDPEEFYRLLEAAEGQAKQTIKTDIPRYIISKIGLNRDRDFADVSSVDSGRDTPDTDESLEGHCSMLPDKDSKRQQVQKQQQPCLEDFETIKLISNGAYGAVYLVRHKESQKTFAMKKLLKNNLVLRNQVEQVFAERDILTFTDNPFVVSFFCSFETKKHLCMVLEYVEGGDCGTLLKNIGGPLSFDLARMYFAETVLALEYLHSYGIVHRDLKPDNLLITLMGHIKLTDFGLSKMGLMNLTTNLYEGAIDKDCTQFKDMQVFGTPEYIAPEVILRQGYGKPVDWWSMGIILYEFLIGCVPFFGSTPEELFSQIINEEIEWPEEDDLCPPDDAKDLILGLLQKTPLERLGTTGVHQLKEHIFFEGLDWDGLLRQKAEFVPHVQNEEDTSYFDTRTDRYNHDADADDTEDDSEDIMFNSFSSCSPRYMKFEKERNSSQTETPESGSSSSQMNIVDAADGWMKSFSDDITLAVSESSRTFIDMQRATSQPVSPAILDSSNRHSQSEVSFERCHSDSSDTVEDVSASAPLLLLPTSGDKHDGKTVRTLPTQSQPAVSATERSSQSVSVVSSNKISHPLLCSRRQPLPSSVNIPKFSISVEETGVKDTATTSTDDKEKEEKDTLGPLRPLAPSKSAPNVPAVVTESKERAAPSTSRNLTDSNNKTFHKSASASQLSLTIQPPIPGGDIMQANEHSPLPIARPNAYSSSPVCAPSLHDISPTAERPLSGNTFLKPSIIIRRGPRGYGFTLRAIRVYCGDSEFYTLHHLVVAVERNSPAMDAGLCTGDLITHVNGISVQGLLHIELVRLILTGGNSVSLRTVPLANTSIRIGARKSPMIAGLGLVAHGGPEYMTSTLSSQNRRQQKEERRRRSSLFRQLSSRKAAEQQLAVTTSSPLSPHRRSLSSNDSVPGSPTTAVPRQHSVAMAIDPLTSDSAHSSSQSSSPGSSAPGSPAVTGSPSPMASIGGRPSTLHGLKHKLAVARTSSGNRRKSWHNNPLSPLVRTPSPSPGTATSPSRSPSPLTTVAAVVHHRHHTASGAPLVATHVPGISNMAQLYSPAQSQSGVCVSSTAQCPVRKVMPSESGELLRRSTALSPERRHLQSEMHRRSMTGQIERRIGLQDTASPGKCCTGDSSLLREFHRNEQCLGTVTADEAQRTAGRFRDAKVSDADANLPRTEHLQKAYTCDGQNFRDIPACEQQQQSLITGSADVRRGLVRSENSDFRHPPSEPLRVDVDCPAGRSVPSLASNIAVKRMLIMKKSPDVTGMQNIATSDEKSSCASNVGRHAGGDCQHACDITGDKKDVNSGAFVAQIKSGKETRLRPAVISSVPVAIRTGAKDEDKCKVYDGKDK